MNRENNLKTFIVRCGEVALKGKNKPYFERVLVERIRRALGEPRDISVKRQEGLIFIKAPESCDEEDIIKKVRKVFGVASISPAVIVFPRASIIFSAWFFKLSGASPLPTF